MNLYERGEVDVFTVIIGANPGAIAAGAFVSFLLSIWKFRAEKRWEKRVDAYKKIIEALPHDRKTDEFTPQG